MTLDELKQVKFKMVAHMSMLHEHTLTYSSEDGELGFCDHTRKTGDFTFGRTHRHWRIKDKVYKSKDKFLEALADYHPAMTIDKLK